MTDIAKIQALDMTKILNKDAKSEIKKLIDDYNTAEDKEDFIEVTKENSKLILELIFEVYPDAITKKENPCDDTSSSLNRVPNLQKTISKTQEPSGLERSKNKDKVVTSKPKTSDVLKALQKEVEECRKRGATRKNTKKKTPSIPKTVYDKVYSHINAIANLLPERFKDDPEKLGELKKMSLAIHKKAVVVFELNETLAEKGKLALKEKFKSMNQKLKTDDNK